MAASCVLLVTAFLSSARASSTTPAGVATPCPRSREGACPGASFRGLADESFSRTLLKSVLKGAEELFSHANSTLRSEPDQNALRGLKKKMATPMLMGMKMLMLGLIPVALAKIALLALAAVVSSKLALLLVVLFAFSKAFGGGGGGGGGGPHYKHAYEGVDDEVVHLPEIHHRRVFRTRGKAAARRPPRAQRLEYRRGLPSGQGPSSYRVESGGWKPSSVDVSGSRGPGGEGRALSEPSDTIFNDSSTREEVEKAGLPGEKLSEDFQETDHFPAEGNVKDAGIPGNVAGNEESKDSQELDDPRGEAQEVDDPGEPQKLMKRLVKRHDRGILEGRLTPGRVPGWRRLDEEDNH